MDAAAWELVPVPLIGWREDGLVLAVNSAAATALGYSREALLGRSYWELTLSGQKQRELALVRSGELPHGKEFVGADGEPITVQVIGRASLPGDGEPAHLSAFIVDHRVGAARDAGAVLRHQNHLLLELARHDAIDAGDLGRGLAAITEAAAAGLGCERSSVWLYTEGEKSIRCVDLVLRSTGAHESGLELFARDFPRYFAALAEDRTIAAGDAHTHPATSEFSAVYLAPLGIGAMLDAPIRVGGRMIGVLCNEHVGGERQWTSDEEQFAASLADFIALAIESSRRRDSEEQLRAMVQLLEEEAH
ncbi:MAG: GAF domain-containing protein [Nannocystis sp.]|nr:GAF domain-containing protein [Nannocystis sp.]MBA3548787.1 GAF domain-containing protein [Nannocystis sp.]